MSNLNRQLAHQADSPRRVLVADDERSLLMLVKIGLELRGHAVYTVESGEEAVTAIESGRSFDIVILDLNMPRMSGLETLIRLREIAPEIPVAIMTGGGTVSSYLESQSLGASEFIYKPVELDTLERMIIRLTSPN